MKKTEEKVVSPSVLKFHGSALLKLRTETEWKVYLLEEMRGLFGFKLSAEVLLKPLMIPLLISCFSDVRLI